MGIKDLFKGLNKQGSYTAMSADELLKLDDEQLRDAIAARMMKESGRKQVRQCLDLYSGAKRTFYIVSLYEAEVSTDGLCRFLVGPGRSATAFILDALREVHASRHAKLLEKFTSDNGIDLSDLGDLRIESSWDYEEQKSRYPFQDFDRKFRKLYEEESINDRLIQYVRNHITQF